MICKRCAEMADYVTDNALNEGQPARWRPVRWWHRLTLTDRSEGDQP